MVSPISNSCGSGSASHSWCNVRSSKRGPLEHPEAALGSPKIFGIGLSKTGTTSLHFALELLGFRSVHASTLFSRVLNREALAVKPLLSTLEEQYDAFLDWPISHLVPQLDRRFPDSKFILTVRDPRERYRSAQRHIQEDRNRQARGLSHAWLELEAEEQFVSNNAWHTSAVRSYFQGRSSDLLVMRLTAGEGWGELCEFLKVPSPLKTFPHHAALGSHQSHFLRASPIPPELVAVSLSAWA
jgi:hypothetical protein